MDLRLSKRGDYVVRSAILLARAYPLERPTKLRQISAEMEVPRTFVSQILGDLVHAGLALSAVGSNGGYRLARPPIAISLLQVVEAGEGSLGSEAGALTDPPRRWEKACPLHDAWHRASQALRGELAATSLAELAALDEAIGADDTPVLPDGHRHQAVVPVADSVQVEMPAPAVATRLRRGGTWLAPHVTAAAAKGEAIRLRLGPTGPSWFGKTVAVSLGDPDATGDTLRIPIAWEATGPSALFPRFEGTILLNEVDPERCELLLSGRYRPPLGRAGQLLDDTLLAYVARATIRSFLRSVAHGLEFAPATSPAHPQAADAEPAASVG